MAIRVFVTIIHATLRDYGVAAFTNKMHAYCLLLLLWSLLLVVAAMLDDIARATFPNYGARGETLERQLAAHNEACSTCRSCP